MTNEIRERAPRRASPAPGATFVLLHGAHLGGWVWRRVAGALRAKGNAVFTPTFTGLGERRHLMSRAITLETWVADVVNLVEAEELTDVVLVAHSFSGIVGTAVADRIPERLGRLVYLDAGIAESGVSVTDRMTPRQARRAQEDADAFDGGVSLPPPAANSFGLANAADVAWLARRMTPQPFGGMTSAVTLSRPPGAGLRVAYVHFTGPRLGLAVPHAAVAKARGDWDYREVPAHHLAMVTEPETVVALLEEFAGGGAAEIS